MIIYKSDTGQCSCMYYYYYSASNIDFYSFLLICCFFDVFVVSVMQFFANFSKSYIQEAFDEPEAFDELRQNEY